MVIENMGSFFMYSDDIIFIGEQARHYQRCTNSRNCISIYRTYVRHNSSVGMY